MSFETLGLAAPLVRALGDLGYTAPTAVQCEAIPVVLAGRDLIATAQTGTGKTAAFALPILQRLFVDAPATAPLARGPRKVRALVITPTRELAAQVHESFRDYGRHLRVSATTIYGGVGMGAQLDALRRGVDVLIATPGRLIDHIQRRSVDLSQVEVLVLDEGDRMLDMGFLPAIRTILNVLPKQRQTVLFSATFDDPIRALAAQFLRDPAEVQCAPRNSVATTVTHRAHPVDAERKRDLLLHLLAADSRRQTLVFGRTKHGSDRLAKQLEAAGHRAAAIHGNKSQNARLKALRDFKDGRITILVATDIAARGLDIESLPCVINFDLPMVAEDYVHRIGRTGRAGAEGLALSLVSPEEGGLLRQIQRLLKQDVEMVTVDGYAPSRPIRMGHDAPALPRAGRPSGQQPPRKHNRRPHAAAQRPAHAGPKGGHGQGRRDGRNDGRFGNNPTR
ncbi:MAG: DEAD/DEAH box helicase [Proteobacteria bacterium]|nr:DEAD/DEAH box helicase [Pseudomonadota bacterium]